MRVGPIDIAPASAEERRWCAELMAGSEPWLTLRRTFEDRLARCMHPEYSLSVAHREGRPCGFVLVHPRGVAGSPYIASIAVAPEFRNAGMGSQLLAYTESAALAAGARDIFLCVSSFNEAARRLYRRLGYFEIGELKDYVTEGASEILMRKRLVRE